MGLPKLSPERERRLSKTVPLSGRPVGPRSNAVHPWIGVRDVLRAGNRPGLSDMPRDWRNSLPKQEIIAGLLPVYLHIVTL